MRATTIIRFNFFAVLVVAVIFGLLAYGGVMLTRDASRIAAVWFPNAILVALLLQGKWRQPIPLIGATFAANILANVFAGDPLLRAVSLSAVNTFEITTIWWGMRPVGLARPDMSNLRDLVTFAGVGGVAVPILSGAMASLLIGPSSVGDALDMWRAWSMTDGLGMLIIAPSMMIIADAWRDRRWPSRSKLIEITAITLAATGSTIYIFWQTRFPFLFLDAPLVLLCAFRLGSLGTAFSILNVAVIATIATAQGHGPIHLVKGDLSAQIMVLQIFLVSSFAMGLPVAATLAGKRRLQDALKQSEERFRHMTEAAPIGVFRADAGGQITYVNRVWSDKVGFTVEQMLGNGWMRALRTTVPFEEDPAWQGFNKPGDVRRRTSCFRGADGSDLWIETVNAAEFDEFGKVSGYIGAAHDVTEQRRALAKLEESEQRFQGLANLAPAGIFRTDAEGHCTYVNASWLQTTGLKDGEWEDERWAAALHPEDKDRVFAGWADAVAEQRDYRADFRWVRPDGSCSWVDVVGRPERNFAGDVIGFIGVSVDITERRRAEQALAEREEQLRLLATNATDAVLRISLTGECLYASPSTSGLLGVHAENLVGAQLLTGFHPDDDLSVKETFALLAAGVIEDRTIAYRSQPVDRPGEYRWLEAHCGLVRGATGVPQEIIASIRDVSGNKALEEDLKDARARAESAASAKAAFLANMSHEIRTPMNGVLGFTELLALSDLSVEQRRQVDLIADSGRSMMRLLNDILDMSKIDAGQMEIAKEPVDLRHKLKSAARLMEPIATSKGVRIEIHVDPEIPKFITGDRLRIRQIMLNLIGNAVKFTEEGTIQVKAWTEGDGDGDGDSARLLMAVQDSGIGISADRLGLIFEQFAQADSSIARKYGGTGLGLAISNNLATLMGGRIDVSSVVGEGTTFTVSIPLVESAHVEALDEVEQPQNTQSSSVGRARLLIAEDHDINQMLILALAEAAGVAADIANDGAEAITMVQNAAIAGTPYDLVLMDMQMPVVDGLEATRQLRGQGFAAGTLPIVALTANAYAEDIQACLDSGMQAHLTKPVRLREIKNVIARFCREGSTGSIAPLTAPLASKSSGTGTAAERYKVRRQETLEAISAAARRDDLNGATVAELASMLHKLAGSAGFFNEMPLGKVAAEAERALNNAPVDQWRVVLAHASTALAHSV